VACPTNSQPATASAAGSCLCNAGFRQTSFYHNDNGVITWHFVCRACPAGTFKEAVGNLSVSGGGCVLLNDCCACGANEVTLSTGSVHSDACVCQPGYGGATCAPCAVGFYKAATSDDACLACPAGSTTVFERSVALADCVAAPGFYGDSSTTFQQCAAGSYKTTTGSGSCTLCPAGSTSPAGAIYIFECVCSLTGWSSDPEHPFGCTCQPGFARDAGGLCVSCAANFFCAGGDAAPAACQQYSTSPAGSDAVADCVCNAGYAGLNGQACTACAAGTYENMASHVCVACPESSSSPAASDAATDCLCNAGYTGPDGQACTACAVGTFKATPGSAACEACATFETTASTASVSADACVCETGAGLYSGACSACPANTFKSHLGDFACSACPASSASPPGSDAAADCLCNTGYSGPDGGSCTACQTGQYKSANGSAPCATCAANSGHALTAQMQQLTLGVY
jgi:hypothetical protein